MKTKKFIYIFAIIHFSLMALTAQTHKIKLWQGDIPGARKSADYIEKSTGGNNGEIIRIGKISEPELTVYLPKPEVANGTAVLIIPGGGYGIVAIDHEGFEVAKWLNTLGIAGVVLKYRLPSDAIMENKSIGPLQDAQEAMRVIRRNADKWNLKSDKIGVIGFSAGGHLASTLSTHYDEKVYDTDNISARPDFSILIYPVITFDAAFTHKGSRNNLIGENPSEDQVKKFSNELQVNSQTPPAFLIHSSNDEGVPVQNSILYYQQLQKNKIPAELHIFQTGGHGYGLAKNRGTESGWPALCANWLKQMGF